MNKKLLIVVAVVLAAAAVWYFGFRQAGPDGDEYQGTSPEECSRLQILCIQGYERFDDAKGCGCRPVAE